MKFARLPFVLLAITLTGTALAQQEPYIEPLNSAEVLKVPIFRATYAPASGLIALTSSEKSVKLVDAVSLAEKTSLPPLSVRATALGFSSSGQVLVTGGADGDLGLWNATTGQPLKQLSPHSTSVVMLSVFDPNLVLSAEYNRVVKLTDVASGNSLGSLSVPDDITSLALIPGGKLFAVALANGEVHIGTVAQMAEVKILVDSKQRITTLMFSPDSRFLVAGCADGSVTTWDAQTLAYKGRIPAHQGGVSALAFDPKSRWLISSGADSTVKVIDLAANSIIKSLPAKVLTTVVGFLSDETFYTGTSTGMLKRWRILPTAPDTIPPTLVMLKPLGTDPTPPRVFAKEYLVSGIAYDNKELGEVTVNGVAATLTPLPPEETARIPAKSVGKHFTFPLKLDSTGFVPFTVKATDKAGHVTGYNGRVQRLTLEQAVEVQSPVNDTELDSLSVPVRFKAWFDVASYSITVNLIEFVNNSVPSSKVAGDVISDEVPLVGGYNQIQLTVTGRNGEHFSKTIGVTRKSAAVSAAATPSVSRKRDRTTGPQKWAVVVGVSDYQSPGIPGLKFADKDADAFANFLRRPEGGGYDTEHLRVLLNKDATLANIKDALINFLNQAIDIDLVIIYFAGHGAPEPARPQNLYLLTYDSDPNALGTTAFPMWDIQTVLQRHINAKRVVVFTDACHSGGISVNYATRGLGVSEQNMINQYLTDLANTKEGTVVFTASAAGEVSQEFPELGHGVFTYYLLEGLSGKADYNNDYTITINEAMQYTEEMVKRKTHGAQNPTRSQTNYDKELTIALVPH